MSGDVIHYLDYRTNLDVTFCGVLAAQVKLAGAFSRRTAGSRVTSGADVTCPECQVALVERTILGLGTPTGPVG